MTRQVAARKLARLFQRRPEPTQVDHIRCRVKIGNDVHRRPRGVAGAGIRPRQTRDRNALRSRTDETEATEIAIAAAALNRMLAFGRPNYVRIA